MNDTNKPSRDNSPGLWILRQLQYLVDIFKKYHSHEGKSTLSQIDNSSEWKVFDSIFKVELSKLDLNLLKTTDEMKAFFINLYNLLTMHALISCGGTSALGRPSFSKKSVYVVGGFTFSLLELEHCVIRGLGNLLPKFDEHDPRARFILPKDERVNFALHYGTKSSPRLFYFSPRLLNFQLDQITVETLQRDVVISPERNKIFLPKVMEWYQKDFPEAKERVLTWVDQMLQSRNYKERFLTDEQISCLSIKYQKFDWDFCYDFRDLSIVVNQERREQLIKAISKFKTMNCMNTSPLIAFSGPPEDVSEQNFGGYVSVRSISNYPRKTEKSKETVGDPICDRYSVTLYENRSVIALADGASWGERPRKAATTAVKKFQEYMRGHHKEISDTHEAADVMLKAFRAAQEGIMEEVNFDPNDAGTTTLFAGMEFELSTSADKSHNWVFTAVSLGDCKAYHVSKGNLNEIIVRNRHTTTDVKDPGGRLGPFGPAELADLRNLTVLSQLCEEGDIIFLCTDGVHDNFNPHILGKKPQHISLSLSHNSWEEQDLDKKELQMAEIAKDHWSNRLMEHLVKDDDVSVLVNKLIEHCQIVTEKAREFMENHPNQRQQEDYEHFPGKMDHATVLALRIGRKKK